MTKASPYWPRRRSRRSHRSSDRSCRSRRRSCRRIDSSCDDDDDDDDADEVSGDESDAGGGGSGVHRCEFGVRCLLRRTRASATHSTMVERRRGGSSRRLCTATDYCSPEVACHPRPCRCRCSSHI